MPLETLAVRHGIYRRDDLALVFGLHRLTHTDHRRHFRADPGDVDHLLRRRDFILQPT